ncbi:MAG: hypothetical protein ACI9UJ_000980 [bacterium]|jgi:hypothetical protein
MLVTSCAGDKTKNENQYADAYLINQPPLLASRFNSLEDLKEVVGIEYEVTSDRNGVVKGSVVLSYGDIVSELSTGVSQDDIIKVRDGNVFDGIKLVCNAPYAVRNRVDLNRIYKLARRRPIIFGEGDVAFYDLALSSVSKLNLDIVQNSSDRDTSEKGYINTMNHIIAQALITSMFSEEMADFVADVHELKNMSELVHGNFRREQLNDENNNPVDNYVDMINNEIGQELGIKLKAKYAITRDTEWTSELLTLYLNDIQYYVVQSLSLGSKPFVAVEMEMVKFSYKSNRISKQLPYFADK